MSGQFRTLAMFHDCICGFVPFGICFFLPALSDFSIRTKNNILSFYCFSKTLFRPQNCVSNTQPRNKTAFLNKTIEFSEKKSRWIFKWKNNEKVIGKVGLQFGNSLRTGETFVIKTQSVDICSIVYSIV